MVVIFDKAARQGKLSLAGMLTQIGANTLGQMGSMMAIPPWSSLPQAFKIKIDQQGNLMLLQPIVKASKTAGHQATGGTPI